MISLTKLKERKLVQWGLAYLAAAWVLLQVLTILHQNFAWPPFVIRSATVVLAVGFFGALILAWYHGDQGAQRVSTVELGMLTGILLLAGAAVAWVGGSTPGEAAAADPLLTAEQGSIAVLPFVNMSGDEQNEYFSDGLSEELLNALAQLPELRVAARTSAFAFEDKDVGIDSIARALNVRHVLEGSVRKAGDRVRITAQLIDAETGYHLWSDTYDRELADIFAVQDEISRAIVEALQIELGGGREGVRLVEQETTVPEAHTLVLRGEHARNQSTHESTSQAERFFRQALALDPEYARAHAGLAEVYAYQAYQNWLTPAEGYARAQRAAEQALSLDPAQAQAHVVLAQIAADRDWDWAATEDHLARALEANPGYARAYDHRARLLIRVGRAEEAIEAGRRAVALDPVSSGIISNLGEFYRLTGQSEKAIEQYRASLAVDAGNPIALANLALTHSVEGRHDQALRWAREAVDVAPEYGFAVATLAYARARAGRRAEAERTLAELKALPDVSPIDLATANVGLGNHDRVFMLLEQAVEERNGYVTYLGVDPVFAPYRDDPRMRRLLDRMGLGNGNG